jgi:hypothetical protein
MKASRRGSQRGSRQVAPSKKAGKLHPPAPPPPLTSDQAQAADCIRGVVCQGGADRRVRRVCRHRQNLHGHRTPEGLLGARPLVVTAPTHKAVQVLPETPPALHYATIHRVLGLQPVNDVDTGEQRRRQTGPVNLPQHALLVVDECSIVGRNGMRTSCGPPPERRPRCFVG